MSFLIIFLSTLLTAPKLHKVSVVFPSHRRHIYSLPTINKGTDRYLGYDDVQTAKNVPELQRHAAYILS